ncbi:hypothetical protein GCM10008171_06060 [Methylopila jiangsuensis]|uniref:Uncharacterized protein n=1 Tax=Methylopila jiangsuensis TaxID=586230 RepID=A0A9W6JE70_9HYPH|nr:hypothetical protein GCM10008171_06060 [Methylopila jiangsuensis]
MDVLRRLAPPALALQALLLPAAQLVERVAADAEFLEMEGHGRGSGRGGSDNLTVNAAPAPGRRGAVHSAERAPSGKGAVDAINPSV